MLQSLCRLCWERVPLPVAWKRGLRDRLFAWCPAVFRHLPAYQRWLLFRPASEQAGPPDTTDPVPPATAAEAATVRAIAMYLPQFHRIPENDRWWGAGFTEWTNVRRGRPFYAGHHQPHVPHPDLGYYDLDDPDVLERQAAMARHYGIHGFCFYAYWFNGHRLLEKPLDRLVASGRPDFPFCVCWANENWTRNWDGLDAEVLIASRPDPADDRRFIEHLLPMLRDRRYIRVEGRPLLLVYHAAALPDPARTAAVWREACREAGIGELHLASVWSRDHADPRSLGFDAAVQFPPLLVPGENLAGAGGPATLPGFRGAILDYRAAVRAGLAKLPCDFPVYRGVMPAWDNTARRMERGTSWIHASPEAYGRWLRGAVAHTCREQPAERRLLFVNAWNEWAEGCHLEPDTRLGYRHLEETRAALAGAGAAADRPPVVLAAESTAFRERLAAADRPVLVDLLFCQPGFHGGGEYGKAVFEELVRAAADRLWVAFDPGVAMEPWVGEACRAAGVPIVAVDSHAALAALVAGGGFETFFTPGLVAYAGLLPRLDPVDASRRTRIVGTVHDIREVTLAGGGPPHRPRDDFAAVFASGRIDTIVTVSAHSRREILRVFGPPRPALVVLAAPEKRRVEPEPFVWAGHDFASLDYAVVVNAGRPEKNAAAAVRAFDALDDDPAALGGLRVVVAGVDAIADVARVRHPHRFVAVPPLPPARFEFLLGNCRFLVYPSLEEGFGYPPVEAMRHGRPAVVSDIGAVREVCGPAAITCDPRSDADIAAAIRRMLRDPVPRDVIVARHALIAARQREDLDRLVALLLAPAPQPAPVS